MRQVKTRKAWRCDECEREFAAGSMAWSGRYGGYLVVDGLRVHFDAEGKICERCHTRLGYGYPAGVMR